MGGKQGAAAAPLINSTASVAIVEISQNNYTSTAFTITLSGVTMGAVAAGSASGITVQTDADTVASTGVASGGIFTQTTLVTLTIAAGDRVAVKASVPVTLAFKTSAALSIGGKITLNYPAGFFAASPNPAANAAGTASASNTERS